MFIFILYKVKAYKNKLKVCFTWKPDKSAYTVKVASAIKDVTALKVFIRNVFKLFKNLIYLKIREFSNLLWEIFLSLKANNCTKTKIFINYQIPFY